MLAYWESEKEEQKRAREKLLKKLMEDKVFPEFLAPFCVVISI